MDGELVITKYGLEGGPIYRLGPELRRQATPEIRIDFKPTLEPPQLLRKMEGVKRDFLDQASHRWRLGPVVCSLLSGPDQPPIHSLEALVERVKDFPIHLQQPRSVHEDISNAGGVSWGAIHPTSLELRELPGVYVAGEMLDWEAPTGGYLIHGSMLTGAIAGAAAAKKVSAKS